MVLSGEAEDAGGLSPVKSDNEAWRKSDRKECLVLIEESYELSEQDMRADAR